MEQKQRVEVGEVERQLRRIEGIEEAKIRLDGAGAIMQICAAYSGTREAKQVTRDIETIMRLAGWPIDWRAISVAVLRPETAVRGRK